MFEAIAQVLSFFYGLPIVGNSYGLAIMLLTTAVMVVLMPLTLKSTKSTMKMQQLQPEMKKLQKKYKEDKVVLNKELMELYSEHKINPVGGCIPMLAQLPVFLVLFNLLRGLSRRVSEQPFFEAVNRAREANGVEPVNGQRFDPDHLDTSSKLYTDLAQETEMNFGILDLAVRSIDVVRDNFFQGLPYVLLIVFVVATSYYQQRQVSARRSGDSAPVINPQQQMLLRGLPLLTGVWSFLFPAGLVIYWATSNTFRIGQQAYITRRFYSGEDSVGTLKVDSEKESADAAELPAARPSLNGAGKKKKVEESSNKKSGSNGAKKVKVNSGDDRAAAWSQRRKAKAKEQARAGGVDQSSRVTPKGTKPASKKKKR